MVERPAVISRRVYSGLGGTTIPRQTPRLVDELPRSPYTQRFEPFGGLNPLARVFHTECRSKSLQTSPRAGAIAFAGPLSISRANL